MLGFLSISEEPISVADSSANTISPPGVGSTSALGTSDWTIPVESIKDAFHGTSLDTSKWGDATAGGATISYTTTGASLNFPASSTTSTLAEFYSAGSDPSLLGSYSYVRVLEVPDASAVQATALFQLVVDDGTGDDVYWQYQLGNLYAVYSNPTFHTLYSVAYNSTTHKYWRIRESGGTTYWDTSADGLTWTNRASAITGLDLSSVFILVHIKCFGTATNAGSFKVDTLNSPVPQSVSLTGVSSTLGFGSLSLHGAVNLAPTGRASSTAFGTPSLHPAYSTNALSGIASTVALGTPSLIAGSAAIAPTGIASTVAFGAAFLTPINVFVTGISSTSAFGTTELRLGQVSQLTGIPTTSAFGSPTFSLGAASLTPNGISSTVAFGTFRFSIHPVPIEVSLAGASGAGDIQGSLEASSLTGASDDLSLQVIGASEAIDSGTRNATITSGSNITET